MQQHLSAVFPHQRGQFGIDAGLPMPVGNNRRSHGPPDQRTQRMQHLCNGREKLCCDIVDNDEKHTRSTRYAERALSIGKYSAGVRALSIAHAALIGHLSA